MRCNQFKQLLASRELEMLSSDALTHLSRCKNCSLLYKQVNDQLSLFSESRYPSFNPYFTEKVMGRIANQKSSPVLGRIRYAMVLSIFITSLIGGLTVYLSYTNNHTYTQYDILSLNDNNISTFALENE